MSKSDDEYDPEDKAWLDAFSEQMSRPGPNEEEFFRKIREQQLGVGLDEEGNLIWGDGTRGPRPGLNRDRS